MVNTSGFPAPVITALFSMNEQVAVLRAPVTTQVMGFNQLTMQIEPIDQIVLPVVTITVDMSVTDTVSVYANVPGSDPILLYTFTGDDYLALLPAVNIEEVSWEEYFNRVTTDE